MPGGGGVWHVDDLRIPAAVQEEHDRILRDHRAGRQQRSAGGDLPDLSLRRGEAGPVRGLSQVLLQAGVLPADLEPGRQEAEETAQFLYQKVGCCLE